MNPAQTASASSPAIITDPALRARWLDAMFDAATDAVILADLDRRIVMANPACRRIFGYDPADMLGHTTRLLYPDEREYQRIGELVPACHEQQAEQPMTVRMARGDGSTFTAELTLTPMRDHEEQSVGLLGIVRDVSDRAQAELERQQSHQRLSLVNSIATGLRLGADTEQVITTALDNLAWFFPGYRVGFAEIDASGRLHFKHARRPEGMPDTDGISASLSLAPQLLADIRQQGIVTVNDVTTDPRVQPLRSVLEGYGVGATCLAPIHWERSFTGFLCLDSSNARQWSDHEMRTIHDVADYLAIAVRDAERAARRQQAEHDLRQREQQLRHQAYHDALTGLPNRRMFRVRLAQALERARHDARYHFAVLFLDFDQFKYVNDSLGHDAGDMLLDSIADRLRRQMRRWAAEFDIGLDHMAARVGGDEFLMLVDGLNRDEDAMNVVRSLVDTLRAPHEVHSQNVVSTASIGVVIHDGQYSHSEQIIRDADIAMYRAKATGRARYALFDAAMRAEVVERARLENDLRDAVENNRLRVQYQPIVRLAAGGIHGFEALVRWPHPEMGMVPPHRFLPLVHELDLSCQLGRFILSEACTALSRWRAEAGVNANELVLNVNLFSRQLTQGCIVEDLAPILEQTGLPPHAISLEVDEATLVNGPAMVTNMLADLHAMGVRITMDQFGSGSPCLAHLHALPVDVLKIAPAFVSHLGNQPQYAAVIQAIITLAHSLDMQVIGEGIESESQLAQLQALDCDMGQGFYLAGPLNSEQALAYLVQSSSAIARRRA